MNKETFIREVNLKDGEVLTIRTMSEKDVSGVAKLEAELFSQPWPEHAFLEETEREDRLFVVAYIGERLAGYMGLIPTFGDGDITNVAVAPDMRRRGIAELMLRTVMEWGREFDVRDYTLEVRVGNAGAIALYEKLGFVTEGRRKNFYEKPREDALIMWKR